MGWAIGIQRGNESELVRFALLAAGKALYLANGFEMNCQFVLRIAKLDHYCGTNPGASLPDAIASLSKDKLLGPTLVELSGFPMVTAAQVELLHKAREARNFIAHEGAAVGFVNGCQAKAIHQHLANLRNAVGELARGDNVVSAWVYEIENKEPAPRHMQAAYPALIDEWIFKELDHGDLAHKDPMTLEELTRFLEAKQRARQTA